MRKTLCIILLLIARSIFAQQPSSADTIYNEALKLELELKEYTAAIDKYNTCLIAAEAVDNRSLATRAHLALARCYENKEPENIALAQQQYEKIISTYSDQEAALNVARRKIELKGVDVYLEKLRKFLKFWRAKISSNIKELEDKIDSYKQKILSIGPGIEDALIKLLDEPDPLICNLIGDILSQNSKEKIFNELLSILSAGNTNQRSCAAEVIGYILINRKQLSELHVQIEELGALVNLIQIEKGMSKNDYEGELATKVDRITKLKEEGLSKIKSLLEGLKQKEQELAVKYSFEIKLDELQSQLIRIASQDNLSIVLRMQLLKTLSHMTPSAAGLTELIVQSLSNADDKIISLAASISSNITITDPQSSSKIVSKLEEITADRSKDEVTRVSAITALEKLAQISSLRILVNTLEDPVKTIRFHANDALVSLTSKDFNFDPSAPYDKESIKSELYFIDKLIEGRSEDEKKILENRKNYLQQQVTRKEAIEAWQKWLTETGGIESKIEYFEKYIASFETMFDIEFLLQKDLSLEDIREHYQDDIQEQVLKSIQKYSDKLNAVKQKAKQDILTLGQESFKHLKNYITTKNEPIRKGESILLAECLSQLAIETKSTEIIDFLRDSVQNAQDQTGVKLLAARSLGLLGSEHVTKRELRELEKGFEDPSEKVQIACVKALVNLKASIDNQTIIKALETKQDGLRLALIENLPYLTKTDSSILRILSDIIKEEIPIELDERMITLKLKLKEKACLTLGEFARPESLALLLSARVDYNLLIQEAARRAILRFYQSDKDIRSRIEGLLSETQQSWLIRGACALALGDINNAEVLDSLLERLKVEKDQFVRSCIINSVGRNATANRRIIEIMINELDCKSELARKESYLALKKLTNNEVDKIQVEIEVREPQGNKTLQILYTPELSMPDLKKFKKAITEWYNANLEKFPQ